MATSTTHVQGFKALPVKYKSFCKSQHWLYCKEHSVREKNVGKPAGRTLFVINIPLYFKEECMRNLFKECGEIDAVYFHQKPTSSLPPVDPSKFFPKHKPLKGFKVAYVVFTLASGLKEALKLNWTAPKLVWKHNAKEPTALKRWRQKYDDNIPDVEKLQMEIDEFMTSFDEKVEIEKQQMKEDEGKPDDEGWITVTRKGRKPGFARKESVEQKILAKESKKKSKKELLNFYRFQVRESKMKNLAELRHKFEEDKKRIVQLRQSRRFKPF